MTNASQYEKCGRHPAAGGSGILALAPSVLAELRRRCARAARRTGGEPERL